MERIAEQLSEVDRSVSSGNGENGGETLFVVRNGVWTHCGVKQINGKIVNKGQEGGLFGNVSS